MIVGMLLALAGSCAARDLPAGAVLAAADLAAIECPGGVAPSDAIGATLARGVGKGVALRPSLLVRALAVRRGERVTVAEGGEGFEVETSAEALADGAIGEIVPARGSDRRHPHRVWIEGEGRVRRVD